MNLIQLAHGSGGLENQQLIQDLFINSFQNSILAKMEDAAVLDAGTIAISTDTFTVSPLFFPGGDIGKLAVAGTVNDVAMRGAQPQYLTVAFVIEEGFEFNLLQQIVSSMCNELSLTKVKVVTGDTKVVPRGAIDQLMINTTGLGKVIRDCSASRIRTGDHIIISGSIARHGACIYAAREEIAINGLTSDCCSLWPAVEPLLQQQLAIHAMRDATRGGISAVLNEWAQQTGLNLSITESAIPISSQVSGFSEILGIDPYILACEGVFLLSVAPQDSQQVVTSLHQSGHKQAAIIGSVAETAPRPAVILKSDYATKRLMEYPSGEILPRIC